ncbi:MAG: TPM domain-containing protein [Melioribacteraceae bacterium]|nr:TPM domain-containing protein [Melioribacteraceae bacterium]
MKHLRFNFNFLVAILLLTSAVIISQPKVPKLTRYCTDQTNTLTSSEIDLIDRSLKTFEDSTSNQIIFLMIPSLDGYPIEMFAYEVASENKIGQKNKNNGVLFLVSLNDRKMRIEVGYGLEGALTDALSSSIIRNEVAPYFRKNEYYNGIVAGLNSIILATKGEYKGERRDDGEDREGFGVFGFIFMMILFFILSRFKRGGVFPIILGGGLGSRSSDGGFGGGGGFGGFSGGGGSFGGGGSSGGW